ncbi:hypothetical protein [Trabulsiella odontotermitis]|uniref:hypothetical protein n=1 Tax=Trabulsiella odontotermitis TaxID=379893 RepID=UPI0006764148|nr:hypothetical protein [Trabulsiella odontotermitis]KNC89688.1 hypothetical protein GM30_06635 [Trabulsiella odontotermitis]
MNILLDSCCPRCERSATLELTADAAAHDPQQIDIIIKCHFCDATFNEFVSIDEMEVIDE